MSTKTEGQMLPTAGPPLQEAEQPHSHYGRSRGWSHDDQMLAPSWLEGMELGCGSHRQTCPWAPCAKARATALGRGGDGSVPALDTSSPWTPRSVSPSSISPGGLAGLSPMPWVSLGCCHRLGSLQSRDFMSQPGNHSSGATSVGHGTPAGVKSGLPCLMAEASAQLDHGCISTRPS